MGISLVLLNVSLMVTLEEKSQVHQSHWDSSSGDHECLYKIYWQSDSVVAIFSLASLAKNSDQ